ncbi:MAG TPA: nucleotidyltransferase family protein [Chthoniobacterales bacterium]
MQCSAAAVPVVILAGGLATRLHPLTETIPKALVEVAGKPFLDHQLELLRGQGLPEVVLCVAHLGQMILQRYGTGAAFGVNLKYSFDGPTSLGTGGAIKHALPLLPDPFFVMYGDSYLPTDFQAVLAAFRKAGQPALMTVFANADAWDRSNVWWEEGTLKRYSKREKLPLMGHIDYGLSVCSKGIFDRYPDGAPFDLATVFEDLSGEGCLAGFEVAERFYEIGSHSGLSELDRCLRRRELPHAVQTQYNP